MSGPFGTRGKLRPATGFRPTKNELRAVSRAAARDEDAAVKFLMRTRGLAYADALKHYANSNSAQRRLYCLAAATEPVK